MLSEIDLLLEMALLNLSLFTTLSCWQFVCCLDNGKDLRANLLSLEVFLTSSLEFLSIFVILNSVDEANL